MDLAYIWLILGIIGALVILAVQFYSKRVLTFKKIVKTFILSFLVITVGFSSLWAFIGHTFFASQIASYIGWAPGSPFQQEVAFANLAFGVLGILCYWVRGNFWTATIIGVSIFLLGDAVCHISNMFSTSNSAPGNAGAVLVLDILVPLLLLGLLVAYKFLQDRDVRSAIKSLERSL